MSDSYDVYVHEGHIVEVHRGPNSTVAQAFGEDWTAPPMVNYHPPALAPVKAITPSPAPALKTADPNRALNTGLKITFTFAMLLIFAVWLILR